MIKEQETVERIVREGRTALFTLVAHKLTKYYGKLLAVDNVSFHLTGNECFGLLGTNGAGKTTTFSMLTGDIEPSGGDAFIKGLNIKTSWSSYRSQIGYCPQFDATYPTSTGREHLELFCALRAVPKNASRAVIKALVAMVDIAPHVDKITKSYSGGNMRRLCLALALVGYPPVLLLDEPTSGVDPMARRKMYNLLLQVQKEFNTAIVLTSHAMEVCESLCTTVAIMVDGVFRCLGPTQHLKSKYGKGYSVQIKLKEVSSDSEAELRRVMNSLFGEKCKLRKSHMVSSIGHQWGA